MCIPVTRTFLYMCVSLPLIERKKWAWNFVDTQTPRADLKKRFLVFRKSDPDGFLHRKTVA